MIEFDWARQDEEEQLLDLANYVFSQADKPTDFRSLHPKVYAKPGFSGISVVARDNGRIKAMANAVHGDLQVGDERLRWGYVGTVSVHPYARGRGLMKGVMPMLMDSCARRGCQFIALSGERQLYRRYGFEDAGTQVDLDLNINGLAAICKGGPAETFRFPRLEEAGEEALELAVRLHRELDLAAVREEREFITILKTWQGVPYAVIRDGKPFGYLYRVGSDIPEFALLDSNAVPSVLACFIKQEGLEHVRVSLGLLDLPRYAALFEASGSPEMRPSCMIRVLGWTGFIRSLLKLQAGIVRLMPGSMVLAIGDEIKLLISAGDGGIQVKKTDRAADLTLDPQAAVRMLCHPLSRSLFPDQPFLNWFPLPFCFPRADMF